MNSQADYEAYQARKARKEKLAGKQVKLMEENKMDEVSGFQCSECGLTVAKEHEILQHFEASGHSGYNYS